MRQLVAMDLSAMVPSALLAATAAAQAREHARNTRDYADDQSPVLSTAA
jgi:hypothetical protein